MRPRRRFLVLLPIREFSDLKQQVTEAAHYIGHEHAIPVLRKGGTLEARMLALALSHYVRGEPRYREKLRTAVENDQSEEARAILALLPEKKRRRAYTRIRPSVFVSP